MLCFKMECPPLLRCLLAAVKDFCEIVPGCNLKWGKEKRRRICFQRRSEILRYFLRFFRLAISQTAMPIRPAPAVPMPAHVSGVKMKSTPVCTVG